MYKIGDFSKLGRVSTRMLRHYDKLGLLTPSHTDQWTNYRYYTIDQLAQLNRIIALKELGFSLDEVKTLIRSNQEPDVVQLRAMLLNRQVALQREIEQQQSMLANVESRLQQIELEGEPIAYEVVEKPLPPLPIASQRETIDHIEGMTEHCATAFRELYQRLAAVGIAPLEPEVVLYHSAEFRVADVDVEVGVPISAESLQQPSPDPTLTLRELPAIDHAATLIYEGPFPKLELAVRDLLKWVGLQQRITVDGPLREVHLSGLAHPDGKGTVPSAVVELQLPIRPL